MTTQIQFNAFNFKSSQVRVITDPNQEFWFCGSDVCYILGYKNAPDALAKHCKQGGIAKRYTSTQSGEQEMIFINEPNLYRLIIKSRKPEAEPFETWVFEEVLPQIRKMGKYEVQPQQLTLPEPKPRGILLDEEAFYVVAKAIAKLNESTFEWEKMMDLFSELESHRNYKTAFNLGVASYNLAQSSEKIIMKNLVQMRNKVWKKEIEDFIFSNPHLQNHTENKLVHYLR
ncbi:Bro-N domain-containing protein [Pasteurella multocida]|uniref:BRO-N domain-containing protein n=2 Tax=Pasteurella multocida TaxID=747 RepID=UPI001C8D3941|nr:Bro-N domain-containing protein [Pasteurella multocida]MCL7794269.1 Bro-N domain-containing protein [Pasteurella multocida]QZI74927.1 Bro-N domain-containing protein [Pasteurella multocida]HEH9677114.1 Bro-N domain-containing protein [Pasteurella multocida]HEH9690436.1 Bro-N domain-containing protein [Pasteurella multocida]HEH9783098.1 Bro-N domain-containing protein [Pasteurella multocida]